ncbi:MAG TPA: Gfo/Idh/MocA family oxidoreductase, partial [Terriglobales bacterium]|nr:Gfo/Idh/MocA family oxidoreductase [Terriglobales bacterium]
MVNFGIVGFGLHAVKRLMPGFARAKNCRVTALARRDSAKARQSAEQFGISHAFTSTEELCKSPDVDAVLVTSPNSLHYQDVLTAIRNGKPVLCEKPLAMNADESREMVEAARRANVLFGVAQVFRFCKSVNRIRELLGEVGTPQLARCDFSFFAPPDHARGWLNDRAVAGGGPIADIGVHCIDTLRYVLQDEVVRVSAVGGKDDRSGDVESSAVLTLEFSRGTLATVTVSFRAEYHTTVEVRGERGALVCDKGLTVDRPVNVQLWGDNKIVQDEQMSNELAYAHQVDEFA